MEYQSYLEFSLNLDGYMDTLRVLENELGCYNLSTIVNKLIRAKQEVDNANNKRKLVDMGDRDDEDMLFKRKSADTQTYVEAGSVTVSEGAAAAADRVDSSDNKGATGGAAGGGATGVGGGEGAMGGGGGGGAMGAVDRLSAPDLAPSVAKDEDGGE